MSRSDFGSICLCAFCVFRQLSSFVMKLEQASLTRPRIFVDVNLMNNLNSPVVSGESGRDAFKSFMDILDMFNCSTS